MKKIKLFFKFSGLSVYRLVCSCLATMSLLGCNNNNQKEYIDFLKLSESTYVGIEEIVDSLDVPWDMQYNPITHSIFFTEIKGNISELDLATNEHSIIYTVPDVYQKRTSGLLALTIHPEFEDRPYLYTCYTIKKGDSITSELLRLRYEEGTITETNVLLKIEGGNAHNGSRMVFGQDGMLYWATGDVYSETHAQDSTSLNGKILRMTDDGQIPADNPINDSYVYAWGFRNIQGLTTTSNGNIIASEHGDAIEDELNLIQPLHNYGWNKIEGYHNLPEEQEYARQRRTTEPIKSWTPVIAPAEVHYPLFNRIPEWQNSLLLGTLKDQSLHIISLNDEQNTVLEDKVYFKDYYGRIRAITSDREGNIYIATSNRDWKPQEDFPLKTDDRILKLSKIDFVPERYLVEDKVKAVNVTSGKSLYQAYCSSCHKEDGAGLEGVFPPLQQTEWIEDEDRLLDVMLNGLSETIKVNEIEYDQMMPSFTFLSNNEIAEIATYVRSSFGNHYSEVDSIKVQEIRLKNNK